MISYTNSYGNFLFVELTETDGRGFLRAFSIWMGISVREYKKICNQDGSNRTDEVSLRLD